MKQEINTEEPKTGNNLLETMVKFVVLPLIILGSILSVLGYVAVGFLIILGTCFLLVLVLMPIFFWWDKSQNAHKNKDQAPTPANMTLGGEENMSAVSSGQYMVDSSVPYEQMSKLHQLAVDRFGGDLELTLDYVFNLPSEEQDAYAKVATERDVEAARHLIITRAESQLGKKGIQKVVDEQFLLQKINMTKEDVLAREKNPFVPKLWLWIGVLLVAVIAVGVIVGLADERDAAALATILSVGITSLVYQVVAVLRNTFRFRKARRIFAKETKE